MENDNTNLAGSNRDPITGAAGAHPVGVGLGAAAGGIAGGLAAGAAAGTLTAGPVGTVVGAAIGAVVGGLGGKAVAEQFDPTVEDKHWRANYENEPYYKEGMSYDDYAPAYRVGGEARGRYANQTFENVEGKLQADYDRAKGSSKLAWQDAKHATRAAWNRVAN